MRARPTFWTAKRRRRAPGRPAAVRCAAVGFKAKKPATGPADGFGARVRDYALSLPGAYEEHPWGESAAKVKGRVFAFLGRLDPDDGVYRLSVKLPESGTGLMGFAFAAPTGYGLGKSGWVTLTVETNSDESPPAELVCEWVRESYRAVAPKQLVAALE